MYVSRLYPDNSTPGIFQGQELYIIGLGASMESMPLSWLATKTCVLLNDGWRHFPKLGPICFTGWPPYVEEAPQQYRVVRSTEPDFKGEIHWKHPDYYVFSQKKASDGGKDPAMLWSDPHIYWSGPNTISCFAVQFAAWCRASAIFLVGCDCGPVGKQHYYPGVKRKRESPSILHSLVKRGEAIPDAKYIRDYNRYRETMQFLKRSVWNHWGIPVLTVSPYIGVSDFVHQHKDFSKWQNKK